MGSGILAFTTQLRVLAALVFMCCFSSSLNAQLGLNQERISESKWRRGFHGFNMIAEGNELERINLREYSDANRNEVLVILFGKLTRLPLHVTNHVNRGGSALLASDSRIATRSSYAGFQFGKITSFPGEEPNVLDGMRDCPIVNYFRRHPVFEGVGELATNRPGFVWSNRESALAAWMPRTYNNAPIIGIDEKIRGGRVVAVGDQSIFTNQMILYKDNAIFADQAIKWLKKDGIKKMLVLVDGVEYTDQDPADVIVDRPPPTREEVLDALSNLPPSAMLDIANSVATVVEDENMVNDFIHDSVDKVPQSAMNRFYILVMFGIACLTFVAAFLFQRKLQGQTASDIAWRRSHGEQNDLKAQQFRERQEAAHYLLDEFCFDLAGTRFANWPSFPTGLEVGNDRESKNIFESMTRMSILYRSKPSGYWSRKKLARLENEVGSWRAYFGRRNADVEVDALIDE